MQDKGQVNMSNGQLTIQPRWLGESLVYNPFLFM